MPKILLLRHGRSIANERGLIASRGENAGEAFGLTREGRDQVARSVREALSSGAVAPPVAVLSSPFLRARESAEIAAALLSAGVVTDERLRERDFGELELATDALYRQVWDADFDDPTHRRWGVESVQAVLDRAGPVVEESAARTDTATVVLCTHGDVASVLLCAAEGVPLSRHRELGAMETGGLRALPAVDLARAKLRVLRDLDTRRFPRSAGD